MKDLEKAIDDLIRHTTAGRAAMLRDILAEVRLLRRERDAARSALREGSGIGDRDAGIGDAPYTLPGIPDPRSPIPDPRPDMPERERPG